MSPVYYKEKDRACVLFVGPAPTEGPRVHPWLMSLPSLCWHNTIRSRGIICWHWHWVRGLMLCGRGRRRKKRGSWLSPWWNCVWNHIMVARMVARYLPQRRSGRCQQRGGIGMVERRGVDGSWEQAAGEAFAGVGIFVTAGKRHKTCGCHIRTNGNGGSKRLD